MKPFRERNLKVVASVSLAVIAAVLAAALNFSRLPFFHNVSTYHADLNDAGALVHGEQVTIAGVKVGTITGVGLDGNHVRIDFTVDRGQRLGSLTSLTVKILSPLGQEYIQLTSAGPGRLLPGSTIPESRTSGTATILSTLNEAGSELSTINQAQLAKSLVVLQQDISGTSPRATAAVIKGLGNLSQIIANRQDQLSDLVTEADQVTATLTAHRSELVSLIGQSNLVLQVVQQRQSDIQSLLTTVTNLSDRVADIIDSKQANLGTLLANLHTISGVLARDSGSLSAAIPLLAGLSTYLDNTTGTGPYFDAIALTLFIDDHLIAQCSKPGAIDSSGALPPGCKL